MKTKLLVFLFFLTSIINAQINSVSIVGEAVAGGWPDLDPTTIDVNQMIATDGENWSLNGLVVSTAIEGGGLKFRANETWEINWGSTSFPNGISSLSSSNIPTVAGIYDVTFNSTTGVFSFVASGTYPRIGIWGPAVDSQNGYAGNDIPMLTNDGIIYKLSGFNFSSGNAYFRQDNNGMISFGSTGFPNSSGNLNGPSIFIPGGEYFVEFNRHSGAYSFSTPTLGILGTATPTGWNSDTVLLTDDNVNFYINNMTLTTGAAKFRKDGMWTKNWGNSVFPTSTGLPNGDNIPVIAGNYNINFNINTLAYNFQSTLNLNEITTNNFKVFPNPGNNVWHFIANNSALFTLDITDMNGKKIVSKNQPQSNFSIDISDFANGLYFAKITSNEKTTFIKLMKN
jgi:hypothetical protein